jgi:uncharacterized protein (TIGR02145 family)
MGQLMKHLGSLLLLVFFIESTYWAQVVSDLQAHQTGQKITITYVLNAKEDVDVSLYYIKHDLQDWTQIKKGVSGNIGRNVISGLNEIIWDVLAYNESFVSSNVQFKVVTKSIEDSKQKEIKSVKVGRQIWMAENLNVDQFRNGDEIFELNENEDWNKSTQAAHCNYENSNSKMKKYGKLYNWYAISDERGLCPTGWRIPTDDDWTILSLSLGGEQISGGKLKSIENWESPNQDATNQVGFNGTPGGYRSDFGVFGYEGQLSIYWTLSEFGSNTAWYRELSYLYPILKRDYGLKQNGYSVRCIKD